MRFGIWDYELLDFQIINNYFIIYLHQVSRIDQYQESSIQKQASSIQNMKIIADENIAFADEAFSTLGTVEILPGREITADQLKDCDVLLVRSITEINETLLEDTPVKFIGSATIGTDHVDIDYLTRKNIFFSSAKGCNADAVCEYVFICLANLLSKEKINIENLSIGIIGAGNIGSRVAKAAKAIGMKVYLNDPPLQRNGNNNFVSLDETLKADVISLHVPLNLTGSDKTFHLIDYDKLNSLSRNKIIINTSRGAVIDNEALNNLLIEKNVSVILDVWENEPRINQSLLSKVKTATPHIAGYSLEGKITGTVMIYNDLCRFLNIKPEWQPDFPGVKENIIHLKENLSLTENLQFIFNNIYNIEIDNEKMKAISEMNESEVPVYFDSLRKDYPLRREFSNYKIKTDFKDEKLNKILSTFRFNY